MRAVEFIIERTVEKTYILYLNGKPAATYKSHSAAEYEGRQLVKSHPEWTYEVKTETCTLENFANRKKSKKSFEDKTTSDAETKPTMPKGTVKVDVSDVYDWYKLGQHIPNLKGLGKHDFGKGPPSTIMSFGDEETEHKYIKDLKKTGLNTTDIDPKSHEKKKGQKTDPTYNVGENFADGKNPGRKGLAKRSGVNTKASVSSLRKTAKNSSGEKQRMAHWLANMKAGRAKKNK